MLVCLEKEIFHDVVGSHDLSFPEELALWQQVFYAAMHRLGLKNNDLRNIIERSSAAAIVQA